jgi:SAM-dependent methyltransferase
MQIVRTLAELDEKLRECDRAGAVSDDRRRAVFNTFRMERPDGVPADPFSPEYREFQMQLYRHISGKDYSIANEATVFDVASAVRQPFPYATGSCATVGEQLIAMGFVMRSMALPPHSRVLELGAGWGNTTLFLAELGHSVTAVDVEPRFCELIRRRAVQRDLTVEVVNADFMWVEEDRIPFDAVIFFESFHHAADHMRLLRALRRTITQDGRLFFGGEPIQPDFLYPWGLRLDGQSLWSIREHGWLELGFNDLAAKSDIAPRRVTRAVANCCPFLLSYVSMEGALALHANDAAADQRGAALAIARHFDIQVNEAEVVEIVRDLALAGIVPRRSENALLHRWSLSEAEQKMVDGALAAYAQYFAERSMGPIVWTRDLFILGEDGTRQPTSALDVSGESRILIYGPYVHLPPGRWSAQVVLGFSKEAAGNTFFIDVFTGAQLGVARVQPASAGIFDIEVAFSVERPHGIGIEVRVVIGEMAKAGQLAFGHVVLTPVVTKSMKNLTETDMDFMAVLDL